MSKVRYYRAVFKRPPMVGVYVFTDSGGYFAHKDRLSVLQDLPPQLERDLMEIMDRTVKYNMIITKVCKGKARKLLGREIPYV